MKAKETTAYPLRFDSVKQKKAITKIAKANNRSLNSQILHIIDLNIIDANNRGQQG